MTMVVTPALKGGVVSDLHLFARKTNVPIHLDAIRKAIRDCDLFVFNGDTFDFRWSVHGDRGNSLRLAREWIMDKLVSNPDTRFVFVLGNHDSAPAYRNMLAELSRRAPNMAWRPYWFRLGRRVFLHGDVFHAGETTESLDLYRARCARLSRPGRLRNMFDLALMCSRIPSMFLRNIRPRYFACRILRYLTLEMGHEMQNIDEVYFGHVHTPFSDFRYRDCIFHNTGSIIRGMNFSILHFAFNRSQEILPGKPLPP